jgi:hypothetical protein
MAGLKLEEIIERYKLLTDTNGKQLYTDIDRLGPYINTARYYFSHPPSIMHVVYISALALMTSDHQKRAAEEAWSEVERHRSAFQDVSDLLDTAASDLNREGLPAACAERLRDLAEQVRRFVSSREERE